MHSSIVTCIAWSDNGNVIVTGSTDCSLIIWDAVSGKQRKTCVGHTGSVQAVCFVTNARILSGSSDKSVMLWDADSGKKLQRYLVHFLVAVSSMPCAFVWSIYIILCDIPPPSLSYLLFQRKSSLVILCVELQLSTHHVQKHKDNVSSVAASKDGQTIASGSWDEKIIVWDIRTGAALRDCRVRILAVTCSAKLRTLILIRFRIHTHSCSLRATPRASPA